MGSAQPRDQATVHHVCLFPIGLYKSLHCAPLYRVCHKPFPFVTRLVMKVWCLGQISVLLIKHPAEINLGL